MNDRTIRYLICLLLLWPRMGYGQASSKTFADVKKIAEELKNIHGVAYQYSVNAAYPNGQTDHLGGEVYVDEDKQLLYNSSDASTIVFTQKWYYKADHRKKTLSIIDMDRSYKGEDRKNMDDLIFKNGALVTFIDSVVMKQATIKKYETAEDTVKIELTFPKQALIRTIKMVYDRKDKMFISYSIALFRPTGRKNEGVAQVITCKDFRRPENTKKFQQDNFFVFAGGKVVVKKYNKYKLYTQP